MLITFNSAAGQLARYFRNFAMRSYEKSVIYWK